MNKFLDDYKQQLANIERFKDSVLDNIVMKIKVLPMKPVHIGNMVYYYVNHNGKDVPAYCYMSDYDENNPQFLPIYDSENTGEFGWSDFEECCRIFDKILEHICT